MTSDQMIEYLAAEEVHAAMRESLRDSVAIVPSNIDLIHADGICEEWSVATQIGAVPLVFYYSGVVVVNTAPYTADVLAWITDKAKLMEMMNR